MEEIKKYVEENKERFLNELFELIRIPSISSLSEHKPDMYRCAEQWTKIMLAAVRGKDRRSRSPDRVGLRAHGRDAG